MKVTMNNPYTDRYISAFLGFCLVMINEFTGFMNTTFLFSLFDSAVIKAFVMGAVGALGGLMAKQAWTLFVRMFRAVFIRKKPRHAGK